ncbi:unnamed protein product [Gemmata massiliana]|uniref:Uncharacterized protein n=1 Tax=Gemmata massiliana TaxID=1210884 RepID=A0A6P2CWT3_9BACT|nr:hypothetical protein [Gemmata massiliana]VTR92174.1 unnamed protein product [Gemmata massiliana]
MTATTIAPAKGNMKTRPTVQDRTGEEKRAKLLDEIVRIGGLLSRVDRMETELNEAGYSGNAPLGDEFNAISIDLQAAVFAYVRALGRG